MLFMLSGYAFAGGLTGDSPETMVVANIVPMPVEVVPPIPEPRRYFQQQRYAMEYQATQGKPFYAQIQDFYSSGLGRQVTFEAASVKGEGLGVTGSGFTPAAGTQGNANPLHFTSATGPQLSIVQMNGSTLSIGQSPQRRLSLIVNDWVFTGTARVAIFRSHDTGATLIVKHKF
ncbi:hypothetical protein [Paraburkholderia sp. ZP32-5]|uniref:hypothetical protein n=1 Tax=Paraburkholderia sp. ZP32-5 TaxID=2883245 RepID=UPI001F361F64|nr:hypothetical protein [Paraburkholderia sp. ZP32-5]